jgi:glutamyl-Q tRNA(Asp) synthetase
VRSSPAYRGRFAPSPTGPLHLGSLLAALASFLDARAHGGAWLLRIEDIDPPREVAGATDAILRSLEAHGLLWDELHLQSTRLASYDAALETLDAAGLLFRCACTRASLAGDGFCGGRCDPSPGKRCSIRLRLEGARPFEDIILGPCGEEPLPPDVILRRRDGLHAYALAVAVDDAAQEISHVLRGQDLLEHTPVQRAVIGALGQDSPAYGHVPVLVDDAGNKLSKQTGARPLDDDRALGNLRMVLRLLGQASATADAADPRELLGVAVAHWDRQPLVARHGRPLCVPPEVGP